MAKALNQREMFDRLLSPSQRGEAADVLDDWHAREQAGRWSSQDALWLDGLTSRLDAAFLTPEYLSRFKTWVKDQIRAIYNGFRSLPRPDLRAMLEHNRNLVNEVLGRRDRSGEFQDLRGRDFYVNAAEAIVDFSLTETLDLADDDTVTRLSPHSPPETVAYALRNIPEMGGLDRSWRSIREICGLATYEVFLLRRVAALSPTETGRLLGLEADAVNEAMRRADECLPHA